MYANFSCLPSAAVSSNAATASARSRKPALVFKRKSLGCWKRLFTAA